MIEGYSYSREKNSGITWDEAPSANTRIRQIPVPNDFPA